MPLKMGRIQRRSRPRFSTIPFDYTSFTQATGLADGISYYKNQKIGVQRMDGLITYRPRVIGRYYPYGRHPSSLNCVVNTTSGKS
jgi:hypothetical protein